MYWAAFGRMRCTLRLRHGSVGAGDAQCLPQLTWRKGSNWPFWSSSGRVVLMEDYKRGCEARWQKAYGCTGKAQWHSSGAMAGPVFTSKCEVRIGGCVPHCRAKTVRLLRIVEQLKVSRLRPCEEYLSVFVTSRIAPADMVAVEVAGHDHSVAVLWQWEGMDTK